MSLDPSEKDSAPGITGQPGHPVATAAPGTVRLPMQARADFFPLTESSVLTNITVEIENKDLQFQSTGDARKAGVIVYGRISNMALRVTNVRPAPGQYRLTLVLRDVTSGATSNSELELIVPRF